MSRRREFPCPVEECESVATRSGYCELHSHDWVAAAEVPIDNGHVAGAVRRAAVTLREETWVKVLDVYCASCRTPFGEARNTPCDSYSSVLRGGPLGTRKKREDDDPTAAAS